MYENIMNSPIEYKKRGFRLLRDNYYGKVAEITSHVVTNDTYRKYKNFMDKNPAARMIANMAKRRGLMLTLGGVIGLATGAGFALAHVDTAYAMEGDAVGVQPNPEDVINTNGLEDVTVTKVDVSDVPVSLETAQAEIPEVTEPVVDAAPVEPAVESVEGADLNASNTIEPIDEVTLNNTNLNEEVSAVNDGSEPATDAASKSTEGEEVAALSADDSNTVDGVKVDGDVDKVEEGTPADGDSTDNLEDEKDNQNDNTPNENVGGEENKDVIDMSQLGDEKGFGVEKGDQAEWVYTPPTTEGETTSIVIYTPDGQAYVVSTPYAGLSETSKGQLFQQLFEDGKIPYNPKDSSTWPAEWIANGITPAIQYILGFTDGENHIDTLAGGFDVYRAEDGTLTFKNDGSAAFHVVNTSEGFTLDQSQRPDPDTIPDDEANKGDKTPEEPGTPPEEPKEPEEPTVPPVEPGQPVQPEQPVSEIEQQTSVEEKAMPQTGDSNPTLVDILGALVTGGAAAAIYAKHKMGQTSNLYDEVAFQTVDGMAFINNQEVCLNETSEFFKQYSDKSSAKVRTRR